MKMRRTWAVARKEFIHVLRDPLTAQGWSKVLFIRGKDALPLLKRAGIEALLVNDKQEVVRSAGWPE